MTIAAIVIAVLAVAFLFGAFDSEESVVEETDNTMMGGGVTAEGAEEVEEEAAE